MRRLKYIRKGERRKHYLNEKLSRIDKFLLLTKQGLCVRDIKTLQYGQVGGSATIADHREHVLLVVLGTAKIFNQVLPNRRRRRSVPGLQRSQLLLQVRRDVLTHPGGEPLGRSAHVPTTTVARKLIY